VCGIKELLGPLNRRTMRPGPLRNSTQRLSQGSSEIGQLVFDSWRDGRVHGTRHESIALESTQSQCQHTLGDSIDGAPDLPPEKLTPAQKAALRLSDTLLKELFAADTAVNAALARVSAIAA
jgi:hypothetical protein